MVNSIERLRAMYPEEYDELMDLEEKRYGYTKQYCLKSYPYIRRENIEQEKLLNSLFPLDFYVWGLDYI